MYKSKKVVKNLNKDFIFIKDLCAFVVFSLIFTKQLLLALPLYCCECLLNLCLKTYLQFQHFCALDLLSFQHFKCN